MNKPSDPPLKTSLRRRGTTLIEVLAGLVVLGTLLVSVAAARGRFLRQWSQADRRLTAIRAADALLAGWLSGAPQNIPLRGHGPLAGAPQCTWTTRLIPVRNAADLQAVVVRLEIFDRSSASSRDPLFNVDFLLHDFRQPVVPAASTNGAPR